MRLTYLMLVFALFSSFAFAQHEDEAKEPGMTIVVEPTFTGTNETVGIGDFIQKNLDYPKNASRAGAEGTVVIQFKVRSDGSLSEIQVVNSVCVEYDDGVKKALKASSGMWTPGTKNGQPVAMQKEIAVVFKDEGSDIYKTAQMYAVKAANLSEQGKYDRAIKLYKKAIVLCPDCALIYQRGLARYHSGDQNGALKDFERTAYMGSHQADYMLAKLSEERGYIKK